MVRLTIIDHGEEGADEPRRIEINTENERLDRQELGDLVYERLGLESDCYTLVFQRIIEVGTTLMYSPQGTEVDLYREVDADVNLPILTTFRGEIFHFVLPAGTTVEEYQRFLARKFLVRPPLQKLYSMNSLMGDNERLSAYAAEGQVRVCLQVKEEMASPDNKVFISVKRRLKPGYLSFVIDAVETFDMLAGRLEREGEVVEGEKVSFVSNGTVFDNWKTLGEYELTNAKLRISE